MRITDYIERIFRRGSNVLIDKSLNPFANVFEQRFSFGIVVFQNIADILTNLANDVTFTQRAGGDTMRFAKFKAFYDAWGEIILSRLFLDGFVVIGHTELGFRILNQDEYTTLSKIDASVVKPLDENVEIYVMKSPLWLQRCMSDKQFLLPYIEYIDNVMNASNTSSARLGNLVVASPKNGANAPTQVVLTKEQKEEIEKQIDKDYGALREQKGFMLLPREMNFQVINLAGLDMRTQEKVKMCVCVIADRLKVPANQIALIDANSSKTLGNGTELREGDFNKYQSFERLLNKTFVKMASDMGMAVDYTIYNKPARQTTQNI